MVTLAQLDEMVAERASEALEDDYASVLRGGDKLCYVWMRSQAFADAAFDVQLLVAHPSRKGPFDDGCVG